MAHHRLSVTSSREHAASWVASCLFGCDEPRGDVAGAVDGAVAGVRVVPWRRVVGDAVAVQHVGTHPLLQVRIVAATEVDTYLSLPRRALPGDVLTIETPAGVCSGTLIVRWIGLDGTELLWPSAW